MEHLLGPIELGVGVDHSLQYQIFDPRTYEVFTFLSLTLADCSKHGIVVIMSFQDDYARNSYTIARGRVVSLSTFIFNVLL